MLNNIPWIATLGCVIFSSAIAFAFLRENPRLFTVMALFAFSWSLLLPYWAMPSSERGSWEVIGVYTGFLTVYIGALLLLHAHALQAASLSHWGVVALQATALRLLLYVVMPSALLLLGLEKLNSFYNINMDEPTMQTILRQIQSVIGFALGLIGFACIIWGVRRIGGTISAIALSAVLICYATIELAANIQFWFKLDDKLPPFCTYCPPPTWYPNLFAIMKSLYTLVFGSTIAYHGMPAADRQAGFFHCVGLFANSLTRLLPTTTRHS